MKKAILAFTVLFIISWQQPVKTYKVVADINTWQRILNVIDLSIADPKERIAIRDFIIGQLNDTTINKK